MTKFFVDKLQRAIYNSVCSNHSQAIDAAREFLLLDRYPSIDEIVSPEYGGFIYCCRELDLNWLDLSQAIQEASKIEYPKPHLRLVQRFELQYSKSHEENSNCYRTRPIKKMQCKLHLSLVPTPLRRPQVH